MGRVSCDVLEVSDNVSEVLGISDACMDWGSGNVDVVEVCMVKVI